MSERKVSTLPVEKIGVVQEREDGVLVTVLAPNGQGLGLLLAEAAASELSGALIERSRQNRSMKPEPIGSEADGDFHVANVEAVAPEGEKCVLRLASVGGPSLTFRLGSRMMRRWRDILTVQIARHERRHQQ